MIMMGRATDWRKQAAAAEGGADDGRDHQIIPLEKISARRARRQALRTLEANG